MMRKALQRNGIFAGRDVEAETHVETDGCTERGDEVFVKNLSSDENKLLIDFALLLKKNKPNRN